MTHIVRDVEKPGSKLHKKETAEVTSMTFFCLTFHLDFQSVDDGFLSPALFNPAIWVTVLR